MIDVKTRTLKNGVRVVTVPMKGTQAVTALVLVKTGSKYETAEISGVSHFLEHLFFKGSKKYPTPRALSEAMDRLGAEFNAFTSTEETGYYVKTAKTNADRAVAIVGDMLKYPKFSRAEMDRERGVIIEELNMYRDAPMRHIYDVWREVLDPKQALGRDIGGTPATIAQMTHKQITEHFRRYYRGENVVVCLAGAVSHQGAFALATKHFRGIAPGSEGTFLPVNDAQDAPAVRIERKKTDQTHVALGFRGVSMTHPQRHAVAVLASLLGGMMSSRMFMTVREKLGLAYSVRTMPEFDTETGSIVTIGGIRNDGVTKAVNAMLQEYARIRRTAPPAAEVQKAKDSMIGRFVLGLEQTDEVANYVGSQELLLRHMETPEEEITAIRKVTPGDIQKAAKMLFTPEKLNLAIIGPEGARDPWLRMLRSFGRR
jgi:predicted Zn-dependent peptidase